MRRRALLAAIGAGATSLPGCLNLGDSDPPDLILGRIEIANNSSESVNLDVDVMHAGELVYDDSIRLDPVNENGEHPTVDSVFITESWMGDPVEYELTLATIDRELEDRISTADTVEYFDQYGPDLDDGSCFAWYAEIGFFPTRELDTIRIGNQFIDKSNDILRHNCG